MICVFDTHRVKRVIELTEFELTEFLINTFSLPFGRYLILHRVIRVIELSEIELSEFLLYRFALQRANVK